MHRILDSGDCGSQIASSLAGRSLLLDARQRYCLLFVPDRVMCGSRAALNAGKFAVSNFAQTPPAIDYLERSRSANVVFSHIHKIKQLRSVYRRHP
jgi:hypothetical protein